MRKCVSIFAIGMLMFSTGCFASKRYILVYCKVSHDDVSAVYDSQGKTSSFTTCSEALNKVNNAILAYVTTSSNGTDSVTTYTFQGTQ